MAHVTAKHLDKVYQNKVHAVKDFSLQVNDGQFVALVGPSGCGKSTFLRMVAGLETITSGELSIDGKIVNNVEAHNRNVAMVFQSHALFPTMSVYENIALGLETRKVPKPEIRKKVNETAQMLGISDILNRKPGKMSGGQRQRVALGRAIVRNPQVFLFDEPLSNLDAKLRGQMRMEMIQLHNTLGGTFLYVTHDQIEAMTMADKIVVMNEGTIMQTNALMALYDSPVNIFVAGFIGSPQMNFLPATVMLIDNVWKIRTGELSLTIPKGRFEPETLNKYVGASLTFGIRPEHISLGSEGIDSHVDYTELTGSEQYFHLSHIGLKFMVRLPSGTPMGENVHIVFDMTNSHLFDSKGNSLR